MVPESSGAPSFNRLVVRIPELGLIFTRIDPSNKETSMLFRVRPGWPELYQYLADQQDGAAGAAGQGARRCGALGGVGRGAWKVAGKVRTKK